MILNAFLDRFLCREVRVGGRRRPVRGFQLCGLAGLLTAIAACSCVALRLGLSLWILAALCVVAIATFLALAMATKIIRGRETLTYYHHEVAVFAVCAGLLHAWTLPVTRWLDVVAVGFGAFLTWGRLGCLMAACCHGRPHRWGASYGPHYVEDGFSPWLVNVRLFPLPLMESAAAAVLTGYTAWLALSAVPPGLGFLVYVAGYAWVRFLLEFLRGDSERPYWRGYSEAQWTSCVVLAGSLGTLSLCWLALPAALLWWFRPERDRRLSPPHLFELAHLGHRALAGAGQDAAPAVLESTLGVRISAGMLHYGGATLIQYSLSSARAPLSKHTAELLSDALLRQNGHAGGGVRLQADVCGGVFHVLVPE